MPLEDVYDFSKVIDAVNNTPRHVLIFIRITYSLCGGCWAEMPAFLDAMARMEKKVATRWIQIDLFSCQGSTAYFNIKKLPTIIAIRNKLELGRYVGSKPVVMNRFIADMVQSYGCDEGMDDDDPFVGL